jgi:hypothetical protein
MLGVVFAIFWMCVWTYLTTRVAERRGRSVKTWIWLGAFFGPFALVTVLLLPSLQPQDIA